MKQSVKPTVGAPIGAERPKALDVLVGVTELALTYRYPERAPTRYPERAPTLADMARVVSTASRLLRFPIWTNVSKPKILRCWHSPRSAIW